MQNKPNWSFVLHSENPETCDRCNRSTRNPCIKCGHALSGRIYKSPEQGREPQTACEVCGTTQNYIGGYA